MLRLCVLCMSGVLAVPALAAEQPPKLSVLIVDGMNNHDWPREIEKALEDYVRGGGLVIYHSADNCFPNWPAYNEMIGLGWRCAGGVARLALSEDRPASSAGRRWGGSPSRSDACPEPAGRGR